MDLLPSLDFFSVDVSGVALDHAGAASIIEAFFHCSCRGFRREMSSK